MPRSVGGTSHRSDISSTAPVEEAANEGDVGVRGSASGDGGRLFDEDGSGAMLRGRLGDLE